MATFKPLSSTKGTLAHCPDRNISFPVSHRRRLMQIH